MNSWESSRKRSLKGQENEAASGSNTASSVLHKRGKLEGTATRPWGGPFSLLQDSRLDKDGSSPPSTKSREQCLVDVMRLLHVMEQNPAPSDQPWISIQMRADLLLMHWTQLSSQAPQDAAQAEQMEALEQRVQQVTQRIRQMAATTASNESGRTGQQGFIQDPLQELLAGSSNPAEETNTTSASHQGVVDQEEGNDLQEKPPRAHAGAPKENEQTRSSEPTSATLGVVRGPDLRVEPSPHDMEDLQRVQREQIEEVLVQMVGHLKQETQRIHSTIHDQTVGLDQLEDIAADNVVQVTQVAEDVRRHVARNWTRTVGTWTMIFTMVGAFLFCLVTIQVLPKRQGACLFFCPKSDDNQFCRILPSGKKECIQLPPGKAATATTSRESAQPQQPDIPTATTATDSDDRFPAPGVVDRVEVESAGSFSEWETAEIELPPVHATDESSCEVGLDGACRPIHNEESLEPNSMDQDFVPPQDHDEGYHLTPPDAFEESFDDEHEADNHWDGADDSQWATDKGDPNQTWEHEENAEQGHSNPDTSPFSPESDHDQEIDFPHHAAFEESFDSGEHNDALNLDSSHQAMMKEEEARSFQQETKQRIRVEQENSDPFASAFSTGGQAAENTERPLFEGKPFSPKDIRKAAASGDVDRLFGYVSVKPDWADKADSNGWNALHLAARAGHTEAVEVLLAAGINTDAQTVAGFTALDIAKERLHEDHLIITWLEQS